MAETEPTGGGFVNLFRQISRTAVAILRNRLELFAVEFEQEKYRQIQFLFLTGGALLLGLLALVLFTAVLVFLFSAPFRLYAAAALGLVYFVAAVALFARAKRCLQSRPFAESINQLKKDMECLTPPR